MFVSVSKFLYDGLSFYKCLKVKHVIVRSLYMAVMLALHPLNLMFRLVLLSTSDLFGMSGDFLRSISHLCPFFIFSKTNEK